MIWFLLVGFVFVLTLDACRSNDFGLFDKKDKRKGKKKQDK
jgi:hypothetical protein